MQLLLVLVDQGKISPPVKHFSESLSRLGKINNPCEILSANIGGTIQFLQIRGRLHEYGNIDSDYVKDL